MKYYCTAKHPCKYVLKSGDTFYCGEDNIGCGHKVIKIVEEPAPIREGRPPKDTYEYWIAYKLGGDYSYSTGYFDGKCWRSAITHKQIPVTHWAFLPQPPKGE